MSCFGQDSTATKQTIRPYCFTESEIDTIFQWSEDLLDARFDIESLTRENIELRGAISDCNMAKEGFRSEISILSTAEERNIEIIKGLNKRVKKDKWIKWSLGIGWALSMIAVASR